MWTRRDFNRGALATAALLGDLPKLLAAPAQTAKGFLHPGMLHSSHDLERMKQAVAAKQRPIYDGFEHLRDDPHSQLDYVMRGPFPSAGRLPTVHIQEFNSDSAAAYQCGLMWAITGNPGYAAISRGALNAWAGTLKAITGVDAILACGLGGFLYLNAAELLRSTGQATTDEVLAWSRMFRGVFLPVIAEFAPFANGNWDTAALKTVMAIGIFCDDAALFDHALQYYLYGCGDGRLTNYIYADGQCQESGRDQAHTQLGLGHMGDCCEMAWQQGLDLYGAEKNRLLTGFEYTSLYQLGGEVPFTPDIDRTGKYRHTVIAPRHPRIEPIFEQIYNHYANRMGIPAPNTLRVAEKIRPEGPDIADHPGFGTLTYSRSRELEPHPAFPGASVFGIRALGHRDGIKLRWLPLHGAGRYMVRYTVERADRVNGPFHTVASRLRSVEWADTSVIPGKTYFYRILRASNGNPSLAAGATAGLPGGWQQQPLNQATVPATAFFTGEAFVVEAGGTRNADDVFDGGIFVSHRWNKANTLTARLVPRIASQQLAVGLMTREETGTRNVALYLSPQPIGIEEHPKWSACIRPLQPETNAPLSVLALGPPVLLNGRVLGELWFRLQRDNKGLQGSVSSDGRSWQSVGNIQAEWASDASFAGLFLNSGLGNVTTEVVLDHVALQNS